MSDEYKKSSNPSGLQPQNRIIDRKCPACGTHIKNYFFTTIHIPTESNALYFFNQSINAGVVGAIPVGRKSLYELESIYLSSECIKCGFLSSWGFRKDEIEYLLSNDDEFYIQWVYNPKIWDDAYNRICGKENNEYTKDIKQILDFVNLIYNKKEEGK